MTPTQGLPSLKVLVIGATGNTGAIAVRQLLARGDEVTASATHMIEQRRGETWLRRSPFIGY